MRIHFIKTYLFNPTHLPFIIRLSIEHHIEFDAIISGLTLSLKNELCKENIYILHVINMLSWMRLAVILVTRGNWQNSEITDPAM